MEAMGVPFDGSIAAIIAAIVALVTVRTLSFVPLPL